MKYYSLFLAVSVMVMISCEKNNVVPPLNIQDSTQEKNLSISDTVMRHLEGIYELDNGSGGLGTAFVCKVSKSKVSFFSNSGGIYIILDYALNHKDSTINFSGFWRYSENKDQGLVHLSLTAMEGGADLLKNAIIQNASLSGKFSGSNNSQQPIKLKFKRPFSPYAMAHEFMIFAHHGVQTTNNPPYTENSLNGAIHDQDYGVNGLEFDVQLTKDHIPICAHDDDIDTRVTEKGPLTGDYIQYDFNFLESSVRLSDGEKIPSVEQVLNAFIDSTSLTYMWLDVKGDADIFKYLEPIVRNAYKKAAAVNRKIEIISDLTSDEVVSEYLSWPSYSSLPTISELGLDDAILHHSKYWGPRYSLGLLLDDVEKAHRLGIKVLSWTLNDKKLISDYLINGKFDGFITDYPAYVVYDYYTLF